MTEAPSFGQSIFTYAPKSQGAGDYAALAAEVLGEASPVVVGPLRVTVPEPEPTATETRMAGTVPATMPT